LSTRTRPERDEIHGHCTVDLTDQVGQKHEGALHHGDKVNLVRQIPPYGRRHLSHTLSNLVRGEQHLHLSDSV
jgi:hypothetical protein